MCQAGQQREKGYQGFRTATERPEPLGRPPAPHTGAIKFALRDLIECKTSMWKVSPDGRHFRMKFAKFFAM